MSADVMAWIPSSASAGVVMPIGGAEETSGDSEILREFVRLSGGDGAQILVIPTASETPEESGQAYADLFRQLGVADVDVFQAQNQTAAGKPEALEMIRRASGIFMSGGDQARLAATILGTDAAAELHAAAQRGVTIAGTSAGAAFMSDLMIEGGESRATPIKGSIRTTFGLGLVNNVLIDTHFGERGRTGRLLELLAMHPHVVTLGLDEDTAAIIDRHLIMRVVGSGCVTILDGTSVRSDVDVIENDAPLMVNGAEMHTVTNRHTFDIRARKFVPPLAADWEQPEPLAAQHQQEVAEEPIPVGGADA